MSGGQRRSAQVAARREAARERVAEAQQRRRQGGRVPVDPERLRPDNSYDAPDYVIRGYYEDRPFTCKDCGVEGVWRATQQKWWYEVAGGDVWSTAVRCRGCRRRERERRDSAREAAHRGRAAKSERTG